MFGIVPADSPTSASENREIAVVASELLGRPGTGGAGTADSLLAVALARSGHKVTLLIASGREIGSLSSEWTESYEAAGIEIRILEPLSGISPGYLAPTYEVYVALRDLKPDVAIVNDWRGLGWAALRARQTGVALTETAFVIHCHGPGRVLTEFAQKVPDTLERFAESVTERASFELADAVVSPSQWLVDWLFAHRWPVPASLRVIPYVRQSAAFGQPPVAPAPQGKIERLAFFGQIREGKGIRIYLEALNELEPELLSGKDLVFLGRDSKRWSHDRVIAALRPELRTSARLEPELTREAALDELRRPGTLAVIPSLLDNAPNTVSECIENAIPFVATATGGIPELVAEADRDRVLCRPTRDALAEALARAITSNGGFSPARPAHDPAESLAAWHELVTTVGPPPLAGNRAPSRVAIVTTTDGSDRRARRLADSTNSVDVEIARAPSRRSGLERTAAEWIVFLDEDDRPDDGLIDQLVAAQVRTGADLVTTSVRPAALAEGIELFLGNPGALGLAANHYGVVGLVRASLAAADLPDDDGSVDPDWTLFARLALAGARIVSIPDPLSTHEGAPGSIGDVPGPGLAVLEAFENAPTLDDLPQLTATLAAALERARPAAPAHDAPDRHSSFIRRAVRKVAR
jgi:glycosyltransferase involved in cell wall biosynthesis